jgi:hypothetical protein
MESRWKLSEIAVKRTAQMGKKLSDSALFRRKSDHSAGLQTKAKGTIGRKNLLANLENICIELLQILQNPLACSEIIKYTLAKHRPGKAGLVLRDRRKGL